MSPTILLPSRSSGPVGTTVYQVGLEASSKSKPAFSPPDVERAAPLSTSASIL
jgi:hypothetical protein